MISQPPVIGQSSMISQPPVISDQNAVTARRGRFTQ